MNINLVIVCALVCFTYFLVVTAPIVSMNVISFAYEKIFPSSERRSLNSEEYQVFGRSLNITTDYVGKIHYYADSLQKRTIITMVDLYNPVYTDWKDYVGDTPVFPKEKQWIKNKEKQLKELNLMNLIIKLLNEREK